MSDDPRAIRARELVAREIELYRALLPGSAGRYEAEWRANIAAWGYVAERIAETDGTTVRMPTTEDEAAMMAVIGEAWLREHAPHRLRANERQPGEGG